MNDEIFKLRQDIEEQKQFLLKINELRELENNALFKKHILEGFCKEDVVTNLEISLNPKLRPETREHCRDLAQSGVTFLSWFKEMKKLGDIAEARIKEDEAEINNIYASASEGKVEE